MFFLIFEGEGRLKTLPISTIIGKYLTMHSNSEFDPNQPEHSEFARALDPTLNSFVKPNPSSCLDAQASETPLRVIHEHCGDELFIEAWLNGKSENSRRAYRRIIEEFRSWVHPLAFEKLELHHLLSFSGSWRSRSRATQALVISVLKSFYSFGLKTGFFRVNLAALLPSLQPETRLTERYLTEDEVRAMIAASRESRDLALVRLLYSGALRVSECVGLNWEDITERDSGEGQITVRGKGNKTRVVLVSAATLTAIRSIKPKDHREYHPVFHSDSAKTKRLTDRGVRDIVFRLSLRAGIKKRVSPHWLRHAHASHALDCGAPISLVQATLGHSSIATTGRYLHARPKESSSRYLEREKERESP